MNSGAAVSGTVTVGHNYAGPPQMGHGGYVAGLFANRWPGGFQVTLRRPTPLDTPLTFDTSDPTRSTLSHGVDLIADAVPAHLAMDVPSPPSLEGAAAAEARSPSRYNDGRGVHPTCFGCGLARPDGDGLRIAAGPVEGGDGHVAATWRPGDECADDDGFVRPQMVVAALDCPGAFAFMVTGERAGLLGRITVAQYRPARSDDRHVVTGWCIGTDGRKLLAGTAVFSPSGEVVAGAEAIWFPIPAR